MTNDDKHIHVAVLIDFAGRSGGAESLAPTLLERLDPARFRRTLVLYRPPMQTRESTTTRVQLRERMASNGVTLVELDRRGRYDAQSWRPFLKLLRSGGVDVLHSHKFGPNLWATLFARLAATPVVVAHEHTWSFEGAPTRRFLDRWLIATGCDAFVAVSEQDRRRMESVERIPAGRVRLLPNGIPELPAPDAAVAAEVRRELHIPEGVPVIGTIGVLRPQKDLGTLVRAHHELLESFPDAHLLVIGGGPEMEMLERLVAELGTGERVRLTGMRLDAVRLASSFDVAVNCSLFEGSALAVIEYMALGIPIVASAVGGTPDLLAGGDAGILVPPSEPSTLARAIRDLLLDPAQARALAARGRARQRQEYDIDVQVQRLQALYEELYARAGGRHRRRRLAPSPRRS